MKYLFFGLAFLAGLTSTHGQYYFSPGWAPGQPIQTAAAASSSSSPAPQYTPLLASSTASARNIMDKIMKSEPILKVFSSVGINITEHLAAAKKRMEIWDTRIPLITDINYGDLIVNEKLTPEQEKERVWFLVVTTTSEKQESLSHLVDKTFDEAYNESVIAQDLPNVRWGRINYLNVTYLTTKWGIWQAPYIIILKDRGQTLRFYRATQLRVKVDLIRDFLKSEGWKNTPPWDTMYSPGGSREWVMDYLAIAFMAAYERIVVIPKFVLLVIASAVSSYLLHFLHTSPKEAKPPMLQKKLTIPAPPASQEKPVIAAPAETRASPGASSRPKRDTGKQRKPGKK